MRANLDQALEGHYRKYPFWHVPQKADNLKLVKITLVKEHNDGTTVLRIIIHLYTEITVTQMGYSIDTGVP